MSEIEILLNSIDKVKDFVFTVSKFDARMELVSGRTVIDAKSIMSIFCVDLSKPMMLRIHEKNEYAEQIFDAIGEYVVVKSVSHTGKEVEAYENNKK